MIIDAHAHACGEFADPVKLTETLDNLGVDKVALCPGLKGHTNAPALPNIPITAIKQSYIYSQYFINPGIRFNYNFLLKEQQDGNQFVYSLLEKCPGRIIQIYWLDPRKPDFITQLEKDYKKWYFKGVKLHQVCTPFDSNGNDIRNVAQFCGEKQLPLFIHLLSNRDAVNLLNIAKSCFGTNFVFLHLVGLETIVEQVMCLDNIYYEISAYTYIKESRVQYAIDKLGADRVILGSDTPWDKDSLKNNIARVKRLNIDNTEKDLILGTNVQKLLRL